jgi:hypothetical protein
MIASAKVGIGCMNWQLTGQRHVRKKKNVLSHHQPERASVRFLQFSSG